MTECASTAVENSKPTVPKCAFLSLFLVPFARLAGRSLAPGRDGV